MNADSLFEAEPYEIDPEAQGMSRTGYWFRQGRNIVVLLPNDKRVPDDSHVYEVTAGDFRSPQLLLRRGSRGEAVAYLQRLLNTWIARSRLPMVPLKEDGTFGLATERRVRSFQRATGLPVDGIVGAQTRSRLLNLVGVPITLGPKPVGGETKVIPECAGIAQPCEVLDGFERDKADVPPQHDQAIGKIADCVVASQRTGQPIVSMLVVGHASSEGPDEYNFQLGHQRAETLVEKLKEAIRTRSQGTAHAGLEGRIVFAKDSGGEKQPIADNATEAGRLRNRRVEVRLPAFPLVPPPRPRPVPPPVGGGITIVAYASGYTSPYANEQAEIAAVKGQSWEPSDEDFAAVARRSSAPLTVSVNSLQLLLDVINSQPPGSIRRLMLVGHSNPTTFSFSGTIRIFFNLRPRFEFAVVNFDNKNAVNKANLVAPSTKSYINRNQLSDRFVLGAEIVLFGCKSGSSGGGGPSAATSAVLLDALSNAFKVCVCGFEKEICSILVHQQIRRGSRIVSERISERGWLAYNRKLACRDMLRDRKFFRTVEQLVPDVRSCVGVVPSTTAS